MSKRETPMTLWYWNQVGGTLIEEFKFVSGTSAQGRRVVDAIIVLGERKKRLPVSSSFDLRGRDVIVVQAKFKRLSLPLMGQTLFSAKLVKKLFKPKSVMAVALCSKTDAVLQPLLEAYNGCEVVVYEG